jgi:hypothetical protein
VTAEQIRIEARPARRPFSATPIGSRKTIGLEVPPVSPAAVAIAIVTQRLPTSSATSGRAPRWINRGTSSRETATKASGSQAQASSKIAVATRIALTIGAIITVARSSCPARSTVRRRETAIGLCRRPPGAISSSARSKSFITDPSEKRNASLTNGHELAPEQGETVTIDGVKPNSRDPERAGGR